MKALNNILTEKWLTLIGGILLSSVLFLPYIKPYESAPGVDIIDLVLPFVFILFLLKPKTFQRQKIYYILGGFSIYIFLTIAVNFRLDQVRDYFEIYKLFKLILLIWLFSNVSIESFKKSWVKPIFAFLILFNLIHFYDLFNFNYLLERYYQAGEAITRFGVNSIGKPVDKRMIGFPCNPNYNAVIFLIFAIIFLPKSKSNINKSDFLWFSASLVAVFLCQSRTILLIVGVILILHFILFIRHNFKMVISAVVISLFSFGISYFMIKSDKSLRLKDEAAQISEGAHIIENDESILLIIDLDTLYFDKGVEKETILDAVRRSNFEKLSQLNSAEGKITYSQSLLDGSSFESESFSDRIEIWIHLWNMVKQKPLFGHGPAKEYFYSKKIYPESEYILFTWRYGFVGLAIYLSILITLFLQGWKNRYTESGAVLIYTVATITISGLTNNPFTHQTILVLLAATIGWSIHQTIQKKSKNQEESVS